MDKYTREQLKRLTIIWEKYKDEMSHLSLARQEEIIFEKLHSIDEQKQVLNDLLDVMYNGSKAKYMK